VSEVACVFRPLVDEVRARGIPPEALLQGIPLELEELGNPRRRISWDDFALIARRCSELFGPDAFEELAARSAESALPAPLRWLLAGTVDVRRAYRIGARFWGPRIFRATRAHCELLEDGRLRETIEILPPYRESPEFFRGVRGLLRAAPRLLGQPDAIVELVSDGRRGEFLIEPMTPPRRLGTLLRRRGRGARPAARRIREAGAVERLARALAGARGWYELPASTAQLVQRELGVRGAALSRTLPAPHDDEVVAEAGDTTGPPSSVLSLVFSRRMVGSLTLWTDGGRALGAEAEQRREALRPLLSLLLEGVRITDANQGLTELLERNLSDWERVETELERIANENGKGEPLLASQILPFAGTVLLVEDDELLRWRCRRELEAQGHTVVGTASDLADLPLEEPASGPIRLVVADLASSAGRPESVQRILQLHSELRGVLLVALRPR
jgi:hypothetical protein